MWVACFAIAMLILFLRLHMGHRKPVRAAVCNMLLGVGALVAVAAVFDTLSVNVGTVFVSLTLGVPGVVLVAALNAFAA